MTQNEREIAKAIRNARIQPVCYMDCLRKQVRIAEANRTAR